MTPHDTLPDTVHYKGSCHCGAVQLSVQLLHGLQDAIHCDCSLCRRRGSVMLTASLDGLSVDQGADKLTLYQFNTHTAKHYFCLVCGIYTHHQRRSDPSQYGVNAGILQGLDLRDLHPEWTDGINHPSDQT